MTPVRWHVVVVLILSLNSLVIFAAGGKHSRRTQTRKNTALAASKHPIYSDWSHWSRCSRRCKQRRTRRCIQPSSCGTNLLREEKTCFTDKCRTAKIPPKVDIMDEVANHKTDKESDDEFRILFHMAEPTPYSEWSEWSPCSTSCLTTRSKTCQMPEICDEKVLEESAICYADDSECEKIYGMKRKKKKSGQDTAVPHEVNPLSGMKCGISPLSVQMPDLRIIGGREARRGSWPWQLTILNKYREPFCGGTLIARSWVLTAAHCLRKKLIVRAGEHNLMSAEGTEQESGVGSVYVHPDYDENTVSNDIALLKLRKPFDYDNYTQPACLPGAGDKLHIHGRGVILGWGKRKATAIYGTDNLHQAEVPIVNLAECRQSYKNFPISENMFCAGYKQGRVDSCAGDSGGPLLIQKNSKWTIYGITSFGDGCGQKGKFGIYSNVAKYSKWIRKTVSRYSW